ncbi:putative F-box protein PP2-B12 [Ziziphus jujuba]|nr:putative F-box protein PP2-B12 [Ziziphus jujuba]
MEKESLELGIWDLPEGCIAHIFSLVSPRDACKCSAVSSKFRLAADSDAVWEMFLPSHWEDIISRSVSPVEFSSLKALYFHLSHSPILLDHGKKTFALDKESGKISYMLGPDDLSIDWSCVPDVWDGKFPIPYAYFYGNDKRLSSRFWEVEHINDIVYLKIHGRIQMKLLSPNTTYAAYLVYWPRVNPFHEPEMYVSVRFVSERVENEVEEVAYLQPDMFMPEGARRGLERSDEWMEVEMGEFFTSQDDIEVEMRLREPSVFHIGIASGLDLQGIEIRPKE